MRKLSFIIVLLATLAGCSQPAQEASKLMQFLENRALTTTATVYIFMPVSGCGLCVDQTLQFMDKHSANEQVQCVVSGYTQKEVNNFLGDRVSYKSVFADVKNQAFLEGVASSSVIFYVMENQQVSKKIISSPHTIENDLKEIQLLL